MRKGLSLPKESFTNESDFQCEYCESADNVESGRSGNILELKCTACGRHGKAKSLEGKVSTGNFFTHTAV